MKTRASAIAAPAALAVAAVALARALTSGDTIARTLALAIAGTPGVDELTSPPLWSYSAAVVAMANTSIWGRPRSEVLFSRGRRSLSPRSGMDGAPGEPQ